MRAWFSRTCRSRSTSDYRGRGFSVGLMGGSSGVLTEKHSSRRYTSPWTLYSPDYEAEFLVLITTRRAADCPTGRRRCVKELIGRRSAHRWRHPQARCGRSLSRPATRRLHRSGPSGVRDDAAGPQAYPAGRLEEYLALACLGVSERLPVTYFR